MIDASSLSPSVSTSNRERKSSTPASAISSRTSTLGRAFTTATVRVREAVGRAEPSPTISAESEVVRMASRLKTLLFVPQWLWCRDARPSTSPAALRGDPMSAVSKREKPPADWELVLKRNPVERLKREKAPLGIRDELPALIAAGYESVAEEDVVRLQWWGLYHDKPKVGTFMLRVKLPSGHLTPAKLRAIGEVSNLYGRGDGELSTRQNIQLHWLELAKLPEVFAHLEAAGTTTAGGCGDTVRNITGCPVQGLAADELFDTTPVVDAAAAQFYGNPDWADLPRKHKYSIAACNDRCNAPEINCVSLIGTVTDDGREGFAVHVGGGLSSVPRIARDMGVFIPKEDANEILGAITSVWSEDLKYRVSRVKARLKFMVDDIGPEGIRERVEARLGKQLEDYELPPIAVEPSHHMGVHPQKQDGLS